MRRILRSNVARLAARRSYYTMENVKQILIFRHGESFANVDEREYCKTPDYRIELTPRGREQSHKAGEYLEKLVGNEPISIYFSPYRRSTSTIECMLEKRNFNIVGIREDPRLRDGDLGNCESYDELSRHFKERQDFGKFFYRFPNGESGADVCDRVSLFLDAFDREQQTLPKDCSVIIVTHGLTLRMFIKLWFHLTVDTFEYMITPPNAYAVQLTRIDDTGRFAIDPQAMQELNLPSTLTDKPGYEYHNKDILGSLSIGAPYL